MPQRFWGSGVQKWFSWFLAQGLLWTVKMSLGLDCHLKAWLGLEDPSLRWLTHVIHELVLAVGQRPVFLLSGLLHWMVRMSSQHDSWSLSKQVILKCKPLTTSFKTSLRKSCSVIPTISYSLHKPAQLVGDTGSHHAGWLLQNQSGFLIARNRI